MRFIGVVTVQKCSERGKGLRRLIGVVTVPKCSERGGFKRLIGVVTTLISE